MQIIIKTRLNDTDTLIPKSYQGKDAFDKAIGYLERYKKVVNAANEDTKPLLVTQTPWELTTTNEK